MPSGTMFGVSLSSLNAALRSSKISESVGFDCFIEREGCEWEYFLHVQASTAGTAEDLLKLARNVLSNDDEMLPAEWIHAPIERVALYGKGNDVDELRSSTKLWEVQSSMAGKVDPVVKFTLSSEFHKRFVMSGFQFPKNGTYAKQERSLFVQGFLFFKNC